MIPIRLKMRNFLPYRGDIAPFSFEGIHLACITGDNGSGKTSIIDAMTWALWGKSRLRSKSTTDDDLITQGESETEVSLDFKAGDDQVYRVVRRRAKPKKAGGAGQSSLNLFLDSSEGFKSYSGNTMSETEDKIKKVLHLDYDTFVSSAYLKQGETDHFTELRPNERKEVLVNILGLDVYDDLAERARDKANQAAASKNMIAASIELEQKQLEHRPELEYSLQDAQSRLAESTGKLAEARSTLDGFKSARLLIQNHEEALFRAEYAIRDIEGDLNSRRNDKTEIEGRIAGYRAILSDRENVEQGFSRFRAVRQSNEDFSRKSSELRLLEKRHQSLEREIIEARHVLETKKTKWQAALDELSAKAAKLNNLRLSQDSMKLEAEKLSARENQMDSESKKLQFLKVELAALEIEEKGQVRRLAEIAEKTGLLASAGEAAACPVCEAELREDRLKMVQAKYVSERLDAEAKLTELGAAKADKVNEITALEHHILLDVSVKADRSRINKLEAQLQAEIGEAESAARRLPEGEKQIAAITRQIELGEYASEQRKTLNSLNREIARLGYDPTSHDRVSAEVKTLEIFDRRHQELKQAENLLSREETALSKAVAAIGELQERLVKRSREAEEHQIALSQTRRVTDTEFTKAESELKNLTTVTNDASEQVGSLKQALAHLKDLENSLIERAAELKRHASDESLYKELQAAFGKNGIQAVLIENAVPEMEAEANRLLAKMTDNRMSLKLELQRATKKGEMAETFDIKIADELGTRDYDLFSGGEAFRINFALRLALSRLLAYRSGAPLRTLIIDEGFGTQDSAGIEKLKEAIASIQDQFDCILVITHIEEFKDAFPARIEVFKTAEGSDIRVSYN
jgi:DNA repair protein SbcC/Rad50